MVERPAVNRNVVGSSPTSGANSLELYKIMLTLADSQNWTRGVANNPFSGAAEQNMFDPGISMGGQHNEIDLKFFGN